MTRKLLAATAAVLFVVCTYIVVGVRFAPSMVPSSWTEPQASIDREADVIAAAREVTNALFDTDFNTIDADNERILDLATGEFKTQFSASQVEVASAFRAEQVVRTVSILKIGVGRISKSSAVVSVAANTDLSGVVSQKDKNGVVQKKPVKGTAPYRWELTMQRVDGRWLLAKLDFVV